MLRYAISNKLTRGKKSKIPQNFDKPKNGWTLVQGSIIEGCALGNLPYSTENHRMVISYYYRYVNYIFFS